MAKGANSSKGNPASHRMSSTHHKEYRARCWRAGQARKQQRIQDQHKREAANRALRAAGQLTPWEVACAERAARRAPLAADHTRGQKREQLPAS